MRSSRFAVAVHVLTLALVARHELAGEALTSERMAASVATNPVVIRRILGALREAGLVTSQPGPGGGWRLAPGREGVTLLDVYRAVDGGRIFSLPHRPPSEACPVGRQMGQALENVFREAEAAMEGRLAEVTMAEVVATVLDACDREGPGSCRGGPAMVSL